MTSMYDEPGSSYHEGTGYGEPDRTFIGPNGQLAHAPHEGIDATPVSTVSTAATAYNWDELDADGRRAIAALVESFGIDLGAVSPRFHVGRTRRGYVLMLTEYELDGEGRPRFILGAPLLRYHLHPVPADDLPAECRAGR